MIEQPDTFCQHGTPNWMTCGHCLMQSAVRVHGALCESQERNLERTQSDAGAKPVCQDCAESMFGQCDRHRPS